MLDPPMHPDFDLRFEQEVCLFQLGSVVQSGMEGDWLENVCQRPSAALLISNDGFWPFSARENDP
jgi:hypothetical protein